MKKIVLLLAVAALTFTSCKKEELEPAPAPTTTPATTGGSTTLSFARHGSITQNAQVSIIGNNTSFSAQLQDCGSGVTLDNFAFELDVTYSITFDVGTTEIYAGDIKFVSGGFPIVDLVEITGNTSGSATIAVQNCNPVQGEQLVVTP